ncbi:MAG: hypothetical protein RLZZ210_850 [Pseudomonadota bacterium]
MHKDIHNNIKNKRIAIIGAGWSGLSCAYHLSKSKNINSNLSIDLFESSNLLGGRARGFEHKNYTLDNGQHILVGAYTQSLNIICDIHSKINQDKNNNLDDIFKLYDMQWHVKNVFSLKSEKILKHKIMQKFALGLNIKLLFNILASNIPLNFKLELIYIILKLKLVDYSFSKINQNNKYNQTIHTVADWYHHYKISNFLQQHFFTPLCLSALNTNIEDACIERFLHALKLTIGSNDEFKAKLIVPNLDLTSLFSLPIANYLSNLDNFKLHMSSAIKNIQSINIDDDNSKWILNNNSSNHYDIVIVATPYNITQSLLNELLEHKLGIKNYLPNIEHMPITTIYVETKAKINPEIPFLVYNDDIIFQKDNNLWAIVCSAKYLSDDDVSLKLTDYILQFNSSFTLIKRICEKRATFKCTPKHQFISNNPCENLYVCGDYLHAKYPATLEAAVESGVDVVNMIINLN